MNQAYYFEGKFLKSLQGFAFQIENNSMIHRDYLLKESEKNSLQERSSLVGHFRELPIWSFRPHLDQVPPHRRNAPRGNALSERSMALMAHIRR